MIRRGNKNVALLTFDLLSGREHLMPWRIFLEVSNYFKETSKNNFLIINVSEEKYNGEDHIISVARLDFSTQFINSIIKEQSIDLLFVPLSWRLKRLNVNIYRNCKCKLIGYVSGSYYSFKELFPNFLYLGVNNSYVYLLDALIPNWVFSLKLKRCNITNILCFNPKTAEKLSLKLGNEFVYHYILPGKDIIKIEPGKSEKYFLWFGSLSSIRGLRFLLDSFKIFRTFNKDYKLKCLIRKDPNMKSMDLQSFEGVEFISGKLEREDFFSYIRKCHAVVLPFLIVPSEVPLSFWEIMQLQKPIITIPNGMVSSLLKETVYVSKNVDVRSLNNGLLKITENEAMIDLIVENQNKFIAKVPSWKEVGEHWDELVHNFSTP